MAIQGEYDPEKDLGATVRFLASIMDKSNRFIQHLDMQINVLIGINTAVFVFSVSQVGEGTVIPTFAILAFFSALAIITSIYAIHPPKHMRKRGQEESLLYNKAVSGAGSAEQYANLLEEVVGNSSRILHQYSLEIYNMYTYYYRPKRKLFKLSRNLFLTGIILALVVTVADFLFF